MLAQEVQNRKVIAEIRKGKFDPKDVRSMDHLTKEVPFLVAEGLLDDVSYDSGEIQKMLDRVKDFTRYDPPTFAYLCLPWKIYFSDDRPCFEQRG